MLDAIDEDLNAGLITRQEADRLHALCRLPALTCKECMHFKACANPATGHVKCIPNGGQYVAAWSSACPHFNAPSGLRWAIWEAVSLEQYPLGWDLFIPDRAGCIGWVNVEVDGYRAFCAKPWGELCKGTIAECARALAKAAKGAAA
jgi:hypothetical protein